MEAVAIVIPLGICVVLPIVIVWIVFRSLSNRTNRQTEVILESIRNNPNLDVSILLETISSKTNTPWVSVTRKLLRGCIFTFIGIAFALIASLIAEEDVIFGCWVICGVFGAIGISFLITYWFAYRHINQLEEERNG